MIKTISENIQNTRSEKFCDFCGTKIKWNPFHYGQNQCRICGKDVCHACGYVIEIEYDSDGDLIKSIEVCRECIENDRYTRKLMELESEACDHEHKSDEIRNQMIELYTKKFR